MKQSSKMAKVQKGNSDFSVAVDAARDKLSFLTRLIQDGNWLSNSKLLL